MRVCFLWSSQTYLKFVEQLLQRHLLFRNTLQERLSAEHWKSLIGDILVQLIGHNDVSLCSVVTFLWFKSLSFPLIHRFSYSSSFVLPRQLFQTCTSDTQRPWRHSSHLSSRDSIILTRVKFCRYFKRFTINIVQLKSTKDTRKTLCVLFYRAARWRERKWNCSPCFWHLSRAYTATWVTFRWVSSQSKSSFEDLQILSVY